MIEVNAEKTIHRLRTAYFPTAPETEHIHAHLSSLSIELARLDALIHDLSIQREKIIETIDLQRALISPIRRLPDDVLQDIFMACLPSHRFAALVLSTPMLWAWVHLPFSFILENEERVHAAVQWIERSTTCPLSLSISGSDYHVRTPGEVETLMSPEISNRLLETLVQSAPRWHQVTLWNLPAQYIQEFCAAPTPLLQAILIRDPTGFPERLDILAAPNVRTVGLYACSVGVDVPLLLSRLSHITHLSMSFFKIDNIPRSVAHAILTTQTHLVSLSIIGPRGPLPPTGTIHFPVLESLDLRESRESLPDLDAILSHLIMPRLHNLVIGSTQFAQSNTSFFAAITPHNFSQEGLAGTLTRFPLLTKLVFCGAQLWEANPNDADPDLHIAGAEYLLAFLTETKAFRSLRILESTYTTDSIKDDTLFKFLQTRVDSGGGFRLNIEFDSRSPGPLPDVQQFRSKGLETLKHREGWAPVRLGPWYGLSND
ncbi:hypothetical protein C8R43DRAFT_1245360 [Mycena crocata]|nr:hypothetical protein C8R43DRAFT_1245360 [Mycena crocata]